MAKINSKLSTNLNSTKNYFIISFKHIVVSNSSHMLCTYTYMLYMQIIFAVTSTT